MSSGSPLEAAALTFPSAVISLPVTDRFFLLAETATMTEGPAENALESAA
jgi:hypothetical protein